MKVIIFIIGTEIFDGKTIDTNSIYLYKKCKEYGLDVKKKVILVDDYKIIKNSLVEELNKFDFLFLLGGLGPTFDDLTLDSCADALNLEIKTDQTQTDKILSFLKERNINDEKLIHMNLRQARYIGDQLKNRIGFALGSYIKLDKYNTSKHIFLLPGPPNEFQTMVEEEVAPILQNLLSKKIYQKDLYVYNTSESNLNNFLNSLKLKTFCGIYAKYHLKIISFQSENIEFIIEDLKKISFSKQVIGFYIKEFGEKFVFNKPLLDFDEIITDSHLIITEPIEFDKIFIDFLSSKNLKFSCAESCTGGLLSYSITKNPGASKFFFGSIVCYSESSKMKVLNVPASLIFEYGVVSKEVAESLANNIKNLLKTDFALAITGYAGPEGGDEKNPIGRCFISISFSKNDENFNYTYKFYFKGNRNSIQNLATIFSMFLAIYHLYD